MADARGATVIILTRSTGTVYNLNQTSATASCWIQTRFMDLGREGLTKLLQRLYFKIDGLEFSDNIQITIYHKNDLAEPSQTSGPFLLNGKSVLDVRVPGAKFYSILFEDTGVLTRWRLSQVELFGQVGGQRF